MDISIVILNYKSAGLVKNCLKSLEELRLPYEYEVILVDNNSQDGSAEYFKNNFFNYQLVASGKNLGFAGGNNLGIRKARGQFILLLNPDIVIFSDAVKRMMDFMKNHPQVGLLGPKLVNPDGTLQYSSSFFPDWRLPFYRRTFLGDTAKGRVWIDHYLMKDWDHASNRSVDWLYGACLFIRKEAIDQVGLLDERYFMYMEDMDWCRRFWLKKWEVWYLAEASVIHYHQRESALGGGLAGLFKKSGRVHLTSWLKYYLKWKKRT